MEDLTYEKIKLLGRLERYEEAFMIIIHNLKDYNHANIYCHAVYLDKGKSALCYDALFKVYMNEYRTQGIHLSTLIDFMSANSEYIDGESVIVLYTI